MLAWIPVIIVVGFLGGCATIITTSSYALIKGFQEGEDFF